MVTSNETRNREAQCLRNFIMEISCFRYFKLHFFLFFFVESHIHFDMASEKTNSARYGSNQTSIQRQQRRKEGLAAVIFVEL